jgi:glycerophosphoryl diester phosphodiesterase
MHLPLVIAHRGDSSNSLENSLDSIRRALSLLADMVEIDIRMNKGGGLYVMHDKTTGRTAERNIDIERSTSEELDHLRLKNGEPVPTLSDVLKLVAGGCGLNLEIKSAGAGAEVARELLSSGYQGYVLLSSFKEDEVVAARRVIPALPTSVIFDFFPLRDVGPYRARGYTLISLRKKAVTRKLIAACHDSAVKVYVWTVDGEEEMKTFIEWGVDGIYTNKPGMLKGLLRSPEFTPHSRKHS